MSQQDLTQQLLAQLQGAPMQQIAQKLGTDTNQASSAVNQAIPMLMNAFGNQSQGGLASILGSLTGGSGAGGLAGMLGGLLGGGNQNPGNAGSGGLGDIPGGGFPGGTSPQPQPNQGGFDQGAFGGDPRAQQSPAPQRSAEEMLDSVMGRQQEVQATEGLVQKTGLSADTARTLLATLVPVVIAFLGQRYMRSRNAEPTRNPGGSVGDSGGLMGSVRDGGSSLTSMLDQTGDGKLDMNDLVKLGSSLFGGKR